MGGKVAYMDNYFIEKHFDYAESDTMNLVYCGIREKCYGHKYNKHTLENYILTFINEGNAEFNINGKDVSEVVSPHHVPQYF